MTREGNLILGLLTRSIIHVREGVFRTAKGQAVYEYLLVVGLIALILGGLIAFLTLAMGDGSNLG